MVSATFYSGPNRRGEVSLVKIDAQTQSASLTAPSLVELPGYTPVGWSKTASGYTADKMSDDMIEISEDAAFYGVYKKEAELSYDVNDSFGKENGNDASGSAQEPDDTQASDTAPESQRAVIYVTVNGETINYKYPILPLAAAPSREGYIFTGWNTASIII